MKGVDRVQRLIDEGRSKFNVNNIIPLNEIISFETEFISSVHLWFSNMSNIDDMLAFSPVRELTMTSFRDQMAELKKAHDMQLTDEKEKIILMRQKQIAVILDTINTKMPT